MNACGLTMNLGPLRCWLFSYTFLLPAMATHGGCSTAATGGSGDTSSSGANPLWNAALSVGAVEATTVAGTAYSSSTKLTVTWSAAPADLELPFAAVSMVNTYSGETITRVVGSGVTTTTVEDLPSGTPLTVSVVGCSVEACDTSVTPTNGSAQATTADEVWHLQGSGHATSGLTKIVTDGNVKIHAFRYGDDAPTDLAGRVQLYYGPMFQSGDNRQRLVVATGNSVASNDITSVSAFTSRNGQSGVLTPSPAGALVGTINTGQALPLQTGLIRIYFETTGADSKTRIVYVDGADGYIGWDFNSGTSGLCETTADYETGGGCEATLEIGAEGDAVRGYNKIKNARQFKIGYPTLDDWRWDQAVGTFMVLTAESISGCSSAMRNHAYAAYDGTAFVVQYNDDGCPYHFTDMQAGTPLHMGGAQYKLYFGAPSQTTGAVVGSNLPFLGPKLLLYADGARSGGTNVVEFADWDARANARSTTWLWPDGTALYPGHGPVTSVGRERATNPFVLMLTRPGPA
jgi:hypothetical protein